MNINNLTIKAQEAISAAQQLAYNASNTQIETSHLAKAMLEEESGSVVYLMKKNDVNVSK